MSEAVFGCDRYAACPYIRCEDGYYYMLYLEHRSANPVLRAEGVDEGVNASDPELVESDGRTWIYFAVGDQLRWMNIKRAVYDGTLRQFLEAWFHKPGIVDRGSGAATSG